MLDRRWLTPAFAAGLLAAASARAHHSYTEYDDSQTKEIAGELLEAAWQNPHALLRIRVAGTGDIVEVETSPLNYLRRQQVPLEAYRTGSMVRVAGWPSKRSRLRMYGTNMLSADGQETVLWRSQPRWGRTAYGFSATPPSDAAAAAAPDSMFHVWVTRANDTDRNRWFTVDRGAAGDEQERPLVLTATAQRAAAAFDPTAETTAVGCTPKGMPYLMSNPAPIELVDRGDVVELRLEEYDTVRTIQMGAQGAGEPAERTLLGRSTGRWEGATLVVETTRIDSPFLNNRGVPLGRDPQLVERFTLSPDRLRLDYEIVVTDPEVLVVPATLRRSWLWRPGERVLPFNCGER